MTVVVILVLALFTAHIIWGAYVIVKLVKSAQFTYKRKRSHIILIILIPLIWSTLIYYMLKKLPEGYEFEPNERFTHDDFHESGKGFYGGFH